MSKTVDERVVEMRFDNQNFERNVQTSMSTLEKLKRSLNLTGAAKGLENVNSAAKNVNMAGLGSSVDTVTAKFSALQVMGVTALANITNSAVNAGKRIVSALTIDPIKSGFQEYETQINAVQTILANTQKEGATIEKVNAALDELNKYADLTIYNFTEMTRNIGTFTAAGVDLETSVSAIQGIANLAAVSGSTSQQASTAMYQLSQALAAGTVKLMDWNSVVNAGMGGQVFQDALRETSELLGTGAEAAIAAQGSFRESLQTGWLTSEVLTETLKKFTTSGANEYVAEYTGLSKEAVEAALEEAEARYGEAEAIEYASKALAEKSGKNAEEIKQALQFAKTAEDAATKVKTFTQLWDVLKEAAQSGWAQTWRIIIGDFEEAKEFFTPVADALTTIIGKFSDARNALLESALGKSFSALGDKLSGLLEPAGKAVEAVENATSSLVDLGKIVDEVILGKFGNGKERFDALTEAGINWYEVQNKVNETLGDSTRYSQEQIDAQNKLLGTQKQTTESTSESATETAKLTDEQKKQIKELAALSDEQLRQKGYTEEQIKVFQELRYTAEKLGIPLNDFIDNLDKINGRWLLLESIKNIGRSIASVFSAIGKAWKEVMDPINPDTIFNIIAAFHKFTASLILNEERANNLKRTFKGLFAILHTVTSVIGGGFKLAFKVLSEILSRFNLDIFEFTAIIGDAFVAVDKFLFKNEIVSAMFDLLANAIKSAINAIEKLVKAFKKLPQVQKFVKNVKDAIEDIKNIDLSEVGANIIAGLRNGLSGGISDVISSIVNIAKTIITTFCEILGIHSPSTVSFEWGKNIIEGLVNGISYAIGKVVEVVQKLGNSIINAFKGIDIDLDAKLEPLKNAFTKFFDFVTSIDYTKLLAIIPIGVVLIMVKKLYDLASSLSAGIDSVNEVILGFANIENNFAKVLKSFSTKLNAQALKEVAVAIAILTGAIIALTFVDQDKLYGSVVIIGLLSGILVALSFAMKKLGDASVSVGKNGLNVDGLKSGLLSIASALLILAVTVKIMGSMDADQAKQGFIGLAGIIVAVGAVFAAYGLLVKGKSAQNIDKAGTMIMKMSVSLLLLVGVVKLLSGVTWPDLGKAAAFAAGFVVFVGALVEVTKVSGKNIDKVGKTVSKISFALILMVGVCKLVGTLSGDEIIGGIAFVGAFLLFLKALMMITKVGKDDQIAKLGGLLMSVSVSMLLMVGVCKLAAMLKPEDILAGVVFVGAFLLFVKGLIKVTTVSNGQQTAKVAATILAFSIAIGVLAAVSILMSMMSLEGLAKGVGAVSLLGLVMTGMIAATKGANNVKGNLVVMTVALAVMAAAVAALSMIDGKKLAGASLALSTVMGMFALMAKAAGTMQSSIGSLLMMTVTVGLLAGIIYLISGLPVESTLASTASLSLLLVSLAASMAIISNAGTLSSEAMFSLAGMFAVVTGLAAIIAILGYLNVDSTLEIAASISLLLLSLSASMVIVSKAGEIATTALGAMGLMLLIVGGIAGILAILSYFDIAPSLETALALSTLLLALSAATVILSMAGVAAPAALAGVAALAIVVAGVGGIITALGYLTEKFPQLEEFLNRGLPILEQIGYGLGSFVGNIISGVLDGAMSSISQFGTELSNFMTNIQPFLDGASNIDESSVAGINTLAQAILTLTGANLLDSITSFITGGSSLETFALQLAAFGEGMMSYSNAVSGINTEAITASAEAAKSLVKVADAIPKEGGLWGLLSGEKDLGSFGSKLVPFGEGMKQYADKVAGINTEAITASASAAKSLVKVADAIPLEGGLWSLIAGDKNLGLFGLKLIPFGEGMKQYAEKVTGIDTEAIIASASAAKAMVKVANSIPKEGGLWELITGKQDLGSFGKKLVPFGEGMKAYAEKVTGIDTAAITASVGAAKAMVKVANAIPTDLSSLVSSAVMATFGKKLASFADAMKTYSTKVAGINSASISASASAVKSLVSVIKSTSGINTSGVNSFVTAINTLGKAQVSKFISAFTSSSGKLKTAGGNMITSVVAGIKSKQSLLTSTTTSLVNVMYKAFNSKVPLFKSTGTKLMAAFVSGIVTRRSSVSSAVSSTVSGAASKLRSYYSSFHSAGAYLATGFANGISSNSYLAAAKAKAMAQAAETAARNALKINSPSKVFIKIGMGVPEGFAKGIEQFGYYVKDSIDVMASDALTNTKKAISRVADVVNSDINAEPTIRPVLDLSDVQSGAGTLNSLFDKRIVLGSTARVNAVSAAMNARNQNGVAEELTSAIDKLRKDLKSTGNTSYTINGITYDDGSNISNAVQELVRAARVERRI